MPCTGSSTRTKPFVRVLALGQFPNVRNVRGSNFCDIGVYVDPRTNRAVVVTAIDNLVKGASGQAIQNMNLMMGFDEREGLEPRDCSRKGTPETGSLSSGDTCGIILCFFLDRTYSQRSHPAIAGIEHLGDDKKRQG